MGSNRDVLQNEELDNIKMENDKNSKQAVHVTIITPRIDNGGRYKKLLNVANNLQERGFEITILTSSNKLREQPKNIAIEIMGNFIPSSFMGTCKFIWDMLRSHYITIKYYLKSNQKPAHIVFYYKWNFVMWFIQHLPEYELIEFNAFTYENVNRIIDRKFAYWSSPINTINTINNESTINDNYFFEIMNPNRKDEMFSEYLSRLMKRKVVFIVNGEFNSNANLKLAIEAFILIRPQIDMDKIHMIISGDSENLSAVQQLQFIDLLDFIKMNNLSCNISVVRQIPASCEDLVISKSIAFIHTNKDIFQSLTVNAVMREKIVISVYSKFAAQLIEHGVNGYFIMSIDDDLAEAMLSLLEMSSLIKVNRTSSKGSSESENIENATSSSTLSV